MPEQLPDEWFSRDERVLYEAGRRLRDGERVTVDKLAAALGIAVADVQKAVTVLVEADYVRGDKAMGGYIWVEALTVKGRRHVGIWPSADDTKAFVQALEAAEAAEPDPVKRGRSAASSMVSSTWARRCPLRSSART